MAIHAEVLKLWKTARGSLSRQSPSRVPRTFGATVPIAAAELTVSHARAAEAYLLQSSCIHGRVAQAQGNQESFAKVAEIFNHAPAGLTGNTVVIIRCLAVGLRCQHRRDGGHIRPTNATTAEARSSCALSLLSSKSQSAYSPAAREDASTTLGVMASIGCELWSSTYTHAQPCQAIGIDLDLPSACDRLHSCHICNKATAGAVATPCCIPVLDLKLTLR